MGFLGAEGSEVLPERREGRAADCVKVRAPGAADVPEMGVDCAAVAVSWTVRGRVHGRSGVNGGGVGGLKGLHGAVRAKTNERTRHNLDALICMRLQAGGRAIGQLCNTWLIGGTLLMILIPGAFLVGSSLIVYKKLHRDKVDGFSFCSDYGIVLTLLLLMNSLESMF